MNDPFSLRPLCDFCVSAVKNFCCGHGQDYDDPRENYWGGVWQIYRAE